MMSNFQFNCLGQWFEVMLGICIGVSAAVAPTSADELGQFEGHGDIGQVGQPGSAVYDAQTGVYTISGGGADMWGKADALHYLYKRASADVTLTADIHWVTEGGHRNRKVCLIIRQNLEPDSPYVDVAAHGDGHLALQWRETADGPTRDTVSKLVSSPQTIRIEKHGDEFLMSVAGAGQEIRSTEKSIRIHLNEPFFIGLGVCSHNANKLEMAEFSKVTIDSPTVGATPK
jgi:TolB protein